MNITTNKMTHSCYRIKKLKEMGIQVMMLTGDNRKVAIRALTCTIKNGSKSIRITDEAMGMRKDFLIK